MKSLIGVQETTHYSTVLWKWVIFKFVIFCRPKYFNNSIVTAEKLKKMVLLMTKKVWQTKKWTLYWKYWFCSTKGRWRILINDIKTFSRISNLFIECMAYIKKDFHFHSYKIQLTLEMKTIDYNQRRIITNWLLENLASFPLESSLVTKIIWHWMDS